MEGEEFKRVLMNNQTWEFRFTWVIREISANGRGISPTVFEINGVQIQNSDVSASNGYNFRVFFELWAFDPENGTLMLGWRTGLLGSKYSSTPPVQLARNVYTLLLGPSGRSSVPVGFLL